MSDFHTESWENNNSQQAYQKKKKRKKYKWNYKKLRKKTPNLYFLWGNKILNHSMILWSYFTSTVCAPSRVISSISKILITVFMPMTSKYNKYIKQFMDDLDKSVSSLEEYSLDGKCWVSADIWCLEQNWFYLAHCLLNCGLSFIVPFVGNIKLPPHWIILVLYLTLKLVLRATLLGLCIFHIRNLARLRTLLFQHHLWVFQH